jgi:hypothetical protein
MSIFFINRKVHSLKISKREKREEYREYNKDDSRGMKEKKEGSIY